MEDGIFNAQPGAFQRAVEQLQDSESESEEEDYEVQLLSFARCMQDA